MFQKLKQYALKSMTLRRMARWYRARAKAEPDWRRIMERDGAMWKNALDAARTGPKILNASSVGTQLFTSGLESVLPVALTLRGADVHILLCDSFLPACLGSDNTWFPKTKRFADYGPSKDLCADCAVPAESLFRSLGLTVHRYSELVGDEDRKEAGEIASSLPLDQIGAFRWNNLAVGEHALAGALRFFARGDLAGEPHAEPILRRYLKAALLTSSAMLRLAETHRFECEVSHHGIYVPQGLIGEVARSRGIRVANWAQAYRKKSFIFSHRDTYHHTMMSEPAGAWQDIPWSEPIESELMDYLTSRRYGTKDWIYFMREPREDMGAIARELGIDPSRPMIGLLTNVIWDAQLHYPANVFPNMLDWMFRTIAYFAKRPDLQLVIRVHPAELNGLLPSRQPAVEEILRKFPELPKNVFIIPPDSRISTYTVMARCNSVLIYGTKTGVELSCIGVPIIVAGEAWIRGKGITLDATSADHYFRMLDGLPLRHGLDEATVQRARRYAYHFFYRRMIPLEFVEPIPGSSRYRVALDGLSDLLPGRSSGLDIICDGILKGTDFIYPAERMEKKIERMSSPS